MFGTNHEEKTSEKTKKKTPVVKIIFYILGVLCIFVGLVSLTTGDYLPGIFFGLFGVLLLPVIKNLIEKATCSNTKLHGIVMKIRIVVMIALLIGFVATLPQSTPDDSGNSNGAVDVTKEVVIHNEQQALKAAKAYMQSHSNRVEQEIADECEFTKFFTPTFASFSTRNNGNSWTITVSGNMAGYTDEHATDFKKYKIDMRIVVEQDGSVRINSVDKS